MARCQVFICIMIDHTIIINLLLLTLYLLLNLIIDFITKLIQLT